MEILLIIVFWFLEIQFMFFFNKPQEGQVMNENNKIKLKLKHEQMYYVLIDIKKFLFSN
jgi:hypothetical protein